MKTHYIKKRSDKFEKFDFKKYKKSLVRSDIPQDITEEIVSELGDARQYFSTKQLNSKTYKLILRKSKLFAANYNMKQAIFNLGPTGYPFELLCAELYRVKGYQTKVSVIKRGRCVKHEVDVVAKRKDGIIYCECKYHNRKNFMNDIKIPLYIYARSIDIQEANPEEQFIYALISNTAFSKDAIRYANGVGLLLYAMNYPEKNTLIDILKKYKAYPVTVLHSLRQRDKKALLELKVIVIKQIKKNVLETLGLTPNEITKVLQEINFLTRPN